MAQTNLDQPLSFSLLAENRADTKEQSAARSALSSASCRRSGCSPAEPYPPHECHESTRSFYRSRTKGASLLCRIGDISTLH
jgi:hypothetical protein